jgi:hypothetical protein
MAMSVQNIASTSAEGAAIGSVVPGLGTIIGAGIGAIAGALIDSRTPMTSALWLQVYPSVGYFNNTLRSYMTGKINYTCDLTTNLVEFEKNWCYDNLPIMLGLPVGNGNPPDSIPDAYDLLCQYIALELQYPNACVLNTAANGIISETQPLAYTTAVSTTTVVNPQGQLVSVNTQSLQSGNVVSGTSSVTGNVLPSSTSSINILGYAVPLSYIEIIVAALAIYFIFFFKKGLL